MNVMNVIIGSTFVLLVAGFFISFNSMRSSEISDPNRLEQARLETRLAQLEAASAKSPISNQYSSNSLNLGSAGNISNPDEASKLRDELQKLKDDRDQIEKDAAALIEDALNMESPKDKRKANLVKTALLMAKISEYDIINKIAGIEIIRVANVNPGDVLGIRRDSKIIGKLSIGTIQRNQGVADPIAESFENEKIDIQVGDELVLPPD